MGSSVEQVTVLVVDDSVVARRALIAMLSEDRALRVIGEAATGRNAIDMARSLRPRVITMDLEMPDINGLEAIEQIMMHSPTRILVLTAEARFRGLNASFEALSRGALDLAPKPALGAAGKAEREALLARLKLLATVPVLPHGTARKRRTSDPRRARAADVSLPRGPAGLMVIGASTGGPGALRFLLDRLPADFPVPIVIVQHIDGQFTESLVGWLALRSRLAIREAAPGSRAVPGAALVAARGLHVVVARDGRVAALDAPPRGGNRPSVDVLFESAAEAHGPNAVGVLLSGMGRDGAAGLKRIRDAGGRTIAQDEATSVVFGMPGAAIQLGAAQEVLGLPAISAALASMSPGRRPARQEQRD